MDDIIENEPSVTEIYENSFLMLGEQTDSYPTGKEYSVFLNVENEDSYTYVAVGDEVIVYHNGELAESYLLPNKYHIYNYIKDPRRPRYRSYKIASAKICFIKSKNSAISYKNTPFFCDFCLMKSLALLIF